MFSFQQPKITKIFYQNAITDDFDSNVTAIENTSFHKKYKTWAKCINRERCKNWL